MIGVHIVGRLISQLRKYAVGRNLVLRLGAELKMDLDWFETRPPIDRPWFYRQDKFSLVAEQATQQEVRRVRGSKFWNRVVRRVNRQFNADWLSSREVDIAAITPLQWPQMSDNVYLYGGASGDDLLRSLSSTLLKEFKLRDAWSSNAEQYAAQIQDSDNPTFFHVCRGDFITNPPAAQFHVLTGSGCFLQVVG
jgi:hypothetical protein